MLADPHTQYILAPFQINSNDHIGRLVDDCAFLAHFVMDRIQKYGGIDAFQWSVLQPVIMSISLFVALEMRVGDTSTRTYD